MWPASAGDRGHELRGSTGAEAVSPFTDAFRRRRATADDCGVNVACFDGLMQTTPPAESHGREMT
jgi:nitrous oxide reductase accessory protein NosL